MIVRVKVEGEVKEELGVRLVMQRNRTSKPPRKPRNEIYLNHVRLGNRKVITRIVVDEQISRAIIIGWVNCKSRTVVSVSI